MTWTNDVAAPLTATGDDGGFDTGRLDRGQSGSATFDQPGTYPDHCEYHPGMTGTVTVTWAPDVVRVTRGCAPETEGVRRPARRPPR